MTKFTRPSADRPGAVGFHRVSLSGALASRQEVDVWRPIEERHQYGRKELRRQLKKRRAVGLPTDEWAAP